MAPKPKTSRQLADKVPIQAVVRAFSVLEALATKPTGVRLADLSRIVGLHKATVYRKRCFDPTLSSSTEVTKHVAREFGIVCHIWSTLVTPRGAFVDSCSRA